jgi:hypothetical protein
MDCVKACPHDNIGLFAVPPAPVSPRIDVAALALVVVIAAFANALWMVAQPGKYSALMALLAVVPLVAVGARFKKELFCRFSQALLPLGVAMWAAHLLFHLFTGWASLGPVVHQTAADFHWHFLSPPQWGMELPLLSAHAVLSLQLLLLDAGLLFTLYLGWRRALEWAARPSRAVLLLLPWATTVAAVYAAGIWILLQPMQMRGMIMNP